MVNISTFGDSAIKFTFTDSDHYLYGDGEITVPVNSLLLVVDESDMVTFKKPDGDSFISFNISNSNFASKAELEAFYKENMTGGGGGSFDPTNYYTKAEINAFSGEVDSAITEMSEVTARALNDLEDNKQDTLIEGVGINIDDNVISVENPSVYLTQAEYDALVSSGTVDPDTYYVISDATAIDINQYYTSAQTESAITAAVSGKQNTLSAGTGIQIDSANTISCTVTPSTYSAGRGIDISNNTISTNLNVYSGQGVASVSLCNSSGNGGGESSIAGMASVGGGFQVTTKNYAETAFGTNNQSNGLSTTMSLSSGATLFSVGNGTGNIKHNAFEFRQNGDIYIVSGGTDIKLQDNLGGIDSGAVQSMIDSSISGKADSTDVVTLSGEVSEMGEVTARALVDLQNNKLDASAYTPTDVVTAITSGSTDSEIPSAKCVYDQFDGLKLLQISQADYDDLVTGGTVDNSTLYIITNVVN